MRLARRLAGAIRSLSTAAPSDRDESATEPATDGGTSAAGAATSLAEPEADGGAERAAELDAAMAEFEATKAAIDRLESCFHVITDIRNFEPGSPEAVELKEDGKAAIAAGGCAAAVRVMPESATAALHSERVGEDEEAYPVAEAESVEEAEELLDQRRAQ